MLASLATRCGAIPEPPERLRDDRATIEAGLDAALARADVLVISGGVSVGPHDHVKPALASLAVQERFWGVGLQPGKPTWFGTRDEQLVFGLPGNPVSAGGAGAPCGEGKEWDRRGPLVLLLGGAGGVVALRRRRSRRLPARALIVSPRRSTVVAEDGAVRSAQSAELTLSPAALERLWSPSN